MYRHTVGYGELLSRICFWKWHVYFKAELFTVRSRTEYTHYVIVSVVRRLRAFHALCAHSLPFRFHVRVVSRVSIDSFHSGLEAVGGRVCSSFWGMKGAEILYLQLIGQNVGCGFCLVEYILQWVAILRCIACSRSILIFQLRTVMVSSIAAWCLLICETDLHV